MAELVGKPTGAECDLRQQIAPRLVGERLAGRDAADGRRLRKAVADQKPPPKTAGR